MTLALICAGFLAASPADLPAPAADVSEAYREARARAGRSPEEQVKLALWCEARGLGAERLNHLALAVLADPANGVARGLMGMVAHNGRFQRPEAVTEKLRAEPGLAATLAEYDDRRSKAGYNAEAQWQMGLWAEGRGLVDQAKAHFTAVTRLDPSRDAAWKRLGCKKHDGRWATDAQVAADRVESEARKQAVKRWKPLLESYRAALNGRDPAKRSEAELALADVTDSRAVGVVARVFGSGRPEDQAIAVRLFGQVESPAASRALATLAVSSSSAEVRRLATETLRRRDPREYLGPLIALLQDPIRFEVRPVGGPGSTGVLFVEGKKANVRRVYAPPPPPSVTLLPGDFVDYDADGLPVVRRTNLAPIRQGASTSTTFTPNEYTGRAPVSGDRAGMLHEVLNDQSNAYGNLRQKQEAANRFLPVNRVVHGGNVTVTRTESSVTQVEVDIPVGRMMVEAQRTAMATQGQLAEDVRALEGRNESIKQSNARIRSVLQGATGQDLGDDRAVWERMWVDRQGYAYQSPSTSPVPTFTESVPLDYQPAPVLPTTSVVSSSSTEKISASVPMPHHSCFAAGTSVRTIDGPRAIETLRAGDRVLAQDTRTGVLGYQPILAVYHNPPASTLRVGLGGDAVVATGIHRFWKAGKGWTMARDLRPGDAVRTLGGVAAVDSVDPEAVQPVFNLEVAEGHSFLVGKLGALVHDNSLVEPTPAPFDAPPTALAAKPAR